MRNDKVKAKRINIAVVVPVYKDVQLTIKCLNYALKSVNNCNNSKLVVINDCSPDIDMQRKLEVFCPNNSTNIDLI